MSDNRYEQLADELTQIVNDYNEMGENMHTGNPLHRARRLEETVGALFWLNAQLIMELAKRDGIDLSMRTTAPVIEVAAEIPR